MNMMHEETVTAFSSPMKNASKARWQRKNEQKQALADSKNRGQSGVADRFIPNRTAMTFDGSNFTKENAENSESPSAYNKALEKNVGAPAPKILAFKAKPEPAKWDASVSDEETHALFLCFSSNPTHCMQSELSVLYTANKPNRVVNKKAFRHISQTPERILDAPELLDDYYLNLIDWSANNLLAVALGPAIYLWNAADGSINQLCEIEDEEDYVCSVNWTADGNYLAVGTASSTVQIWDVERKKQLRAMHGHQARVSSLAWNQHCIASGSKDSQIHNHDVRVQDHHIATMGAHTGEVCGLKWSPSGDQLASGGNDNLVNIWQPGGGGVIEPTHQLTAHQAAVKALAWCPHEANTLATGGGTADRTIKFWNTQTGDLRNSVDTKSQVCSLLWSPHEKELISGHGYAQNQLCVWKYGVNSNLQKMAELTGHSSRVLHLGAFLSSRQQPSGGLIPSRFPYRPTIPMEHRG